MQSIPANGSCGARRSVLGFTLIELMIAVAVVAILATIAVPAYQDQVRKSRRAQAKADMVEYGQRAERFHTVNNTYQGFTLPTTQSPREGTTSRYVLGIQQTATTFTITATPQSSQAKDKCGTLTVNQAGVKTPAGATVAGCW